MPPADACRPAIAATNPRPAPTRPVANPRYAACARVFCSALPVGFDRGHSARSQRKNAPPACPATGWERPSTPDDPESTAQRNPKITRDNSWSLPEFKPISAATKWSVKSVDESLITAPGKFQPPFTTGDGTLHNWARHAYRRARRSNVMSWQHAKLTGRRRGLAKLSDSSLGERPPGTMRMRPAV